MFGTFLIWRIDNPRVERFRAAVIDRVVPSFDWALAPVTGVINLVQDFQSYQQLAEQNDDLRRELQQMKAWKEAALQLEQENAKLLDLNVGARDGIIDGWPTMDGIGLVGRIAGVGEKTSRVLLLTDTSSKIPITIQPSGQQAILTGDNTLNPPIDFLDNADVVRPGDRVITSGDGGVFPADLQVGQVALGNDDRLRVRLSADYERLKFLRVLRARPHEVIIDPGALLRPGAVLLPPPATLPTAPQASAEATDG